MELWVRNQDKTRLTQVTNVELYEQEKGYYKINNLGIYKTRERALEVMDEIQNTILGNDKYKYTKIPVSNSTTNNIVFEMPED